MRTRRGHCYPEVHMFCSQKRRRDFSGDNMIRRKRQKASPVTAGKSDLFDSLPDDLVLCILTKLSCTAACPADFINVLITYVYDSSLDFFSFLTNRFAAPSVYAASIRFDGFLGLHCFSYLIFFFFKWKGNSLVHFF